LEKGPRFFNYKPLALVVEGGFLQGAASEEEGSSSNLVKLDHLMPPQQIQKICLEEEEERGRNQRR
jgi:hypothetical protein